MDKWVLQVQKKKDNFYRLPCNEISTELFCRMKNMAGLGSSSIVASTKCCEESDEGSLAEGPVPYGYHPVCEAHSPMLSNSSSGTGSENDTESDDEGGLRLVPVVGASGSAPPVPAASHCPASGSRVGNVDWCRCGSCIAMSTHLESLCCVEIGDIQHRITDNECITEEDDFSPVCINMAVLDVGLLSMHDLHANSLIRPVSSR